jgi:hypothetical protein
MTINLCIYNSIYEAYVHKDEQVQCTFDELVEFFKDYQKETEDKTSGHLFNCCSYKTTDYLTPDYVKIGDKNDYIRRCKENVDKIYCLLLDVDGTQTLEESIKIWQNYEFLIYSTHSNSLNKEKFRLVIPLKTPMTNTEFDSRHDSMVEILGVDGASFTISQCFYLPTYSKDNKNISFIHHNKGELFDGLILPEKELNLNIQHEKPSFHGRSPIAQLVFNTLLTGRDLHYSDALSLAILCKSKGLSSSEYTQIVQTISAPDSDLRTKKVNLGKLYSQGFDSFMTDKKAIELMKRLNCNMWRFNIIKSSHF